jgi:hypothetical protein
LDSRGDLVWMVIAEGQILQEDFSKSSGVARCFLAGSLSELWKWHRKLGHLSFDLLSCLSKLNLVHGLLRSRFENELVCAPCRHAKMVAPSHLGCGTLSMSGSYFWRERWRRLVLFEILSWG